MNDNGKQTDIVQLHITTNNDDGSSMEDLFCYKKKRKNVMWTKEEVDKLQDGIRKYGKGSWKHILQEFKDDFDPNRRYRDLSDKIRIVEKDTSYRRKQKTEFWEVDGHKNPILSNMGEPIKYFCKFPYEAAYKCACTKNYKNGDYTIRMCYEEANRTWMHVYNARYVKTGQKRVQIRKMAGQSVYRSDGM